MSSLCDPTKVPKDKSTKNNIKIFDTLLLIFFFQVLIYHRTDPVRTCGRQLLNIIHSLDYKVQNYPVEGNFIYITLREIR